MASSPAADDFANQEHWQVGKHPGGIAAVAPPVAVLGRGHEEEEVVPELAKPPSPEPDLEEKQLIQRAKEISYFSIVVSALIGFTGLAIGLRDGALAILGLGGETLLDGVSSAMVLWRFKRPKTREFQDEEEARARKESRDALREQKSAIGIGIGFVLFGVFLFVTSVYQIVFKHVLAPDTIESEREGANLSTLVALPSFFLLVGLGGLKWRLGRMLDSLVLRQDAICSAFGALLSLITGLAGYIEEALDHAGQDSAAFGVIDPTASALISLLIFGEGVRTIRHNRSPADTERNRIETSSLSDNRVL
eukprot:TRINITY_DN74365_c0_g1_i1.p1 TRINITY_DN74365_c0_g1~~TRINITY_DN74365_c0_g1_i1.p1  ORF type:complete len:307 (-),score=59.17 TRINITY_DN74365_c0_g1_i1:88-1008(-)